MSRVEGESRGEIEPQPKPLIAVVMGSDSDLKVMIGAVDVLEELKIPYSAHILSAHRTPQEMFDFASNAIDLGYEAIIAGAGGAAHLPGMIASRTRLPVIGVPIAGELLRGMDALLSQVQMPKGRPVGVMSIDGADNAAIYAAEQLARKFPEIDRRLEAYFQNMHDVVVEKNQRLNVIDPHEYLREMQERLRGGQI